MTFQAHSQIDARVATRPAAARETYRQSLLALATSRNHAGVFFDELDVRHRELNRQYPPAPARPPRKRPLLGDMIERFIKDSGIGKAAEWLRMFDPASCDCPRRKAFWNALHLALRERGVI